MLWSYNNCNRDDDGVVACDMVSSCVRFPRFEFVMCLDFIFMTSVPLLSLSYWLHYCACCTSTPKRLIQWVSIREQYVFSVAGAELFLMVAGSSISATFIHICLSRAFHVIDTFSINCDGMQFPFLFAE